MIAFSPARRQRFENVMAAALMTAPPRDYRAAAAECQTIAEKWSDLLSQQYEELARQWLLLAQPAAIGIRTQRY